jgi:hypothetical protein
MILLGMSETAWIQMLMNGRRYLNIGIWSQHPEFLY